MLRRYGDEYYYECLSRFQWEPSNHSQSTLVSFNQPSCTHAHLCSPRLPTASPRYLVLPTQRMMKHEACTHAHQASLIIASILHVPSPSLRANDECSGPKGQKIERCDNGSIGWRTKNRKGIRPPVSSRFMYARATSAVQGRCFTTTFSKVSTLM